jgi:hypothetical protein
VTTVRRASLDARKEIPMRALPWLLVLLAACGADADHDGFPAGEDCDDDDPAVFPGAVEVCNDVDDDCDVLIDPPTAEGTQIVHPDKDGDGFGSDAQTNKACDVPVGWTNDGTDCDDEDAAVHPGAGCP